MEIIIGSVVSIITQLFKKFKFGRTTVLAFVVALSLLTAVGYQYLNASGYWQSFGMILASAGAFHNFILRRFEESE